MSRFRGPYFPSCQRGRLSDLSPSFELLAMVMPPLRVHSIPDRPFHLVAVTPCSYARATDAGKSVGSVRDVSAVIVSGSLRVGFFQGDAGLFRLASGFRLLRFVLG